MATTLEKYFKPFRDNIIGINQTFDTPFGTKKIIYTDWTASGRNYKTIEDKLNNDFSPFIGNTHTETSVTGTAMTMAYHKARNIIKKHVNAGENDVLITTGTGMTGAINKFQRILGLKITDNLKQYTTIPPALKPIVFISHMEHHSNHTSWLETIADVEIIPWDKDGLVCLKEFKTLLEKYKNRTYKIAAITACSNVTGIQPEYYQVAKLIHQHKGLCFVDFACSAPYVKIDMHPEDKNAYLDAVLFSPHKFLGGPGTSGVLIFNKKLYNNITPDCPGGGTVTYTNPWGTHDYIEDIELREDGGTPGFLQTIKTALAIQLKEKMGVDNIQNREHELIKLVFNKLSDLDNLHLLAKKHQNRLGVFSFYIDELHFNLAVKILNDRFGIQTRGGCSCAGTYGHFLLNIDNKTSEEIEKQILEGELFSRPGWVRMSIHPTNTDEEINFVCDSIIALSKNHKEWAKDYSYDSNTNEYTHHNDMHWIKDKVNSWFE
jgi:selenocysteine lyase/cysteine desulfurase